MRARFCFGYEAPRTFLGNVEFGGDFEDSSYFELDAPDEPSALEGGQRLASSFVDWLWHREGTPRPRGAVWDHAYWLEPPGPASSRAPTILVGVGGSVPALSELETAFRAAWEGR